MDRMNRSFKIIFMGTPDFAVPALRELDRLGHKVVLTVTQPDRPKGRGKKTAFSPVKMAAIEMELPLLQPDSIKHPHLVDELSALQPDFIVVVAYGQILPQALLDIPVYATINIHASLLPKYRGAAPIQWAIINGETETGVCTMKMDAGLDTGDILMCEKTPIAFDDNSATLHDRLSQMGAAVLISTLENLAAGKIDFLPQDHAIATYAPLLKKSDGHIDWSKPAGELYNFIRGISPWPGAFTFHDGNRLKIVSARPIHSPVTDPAGTVVRSFPDELNVAAGDGLLSVIEIQGASGKRLPVKEFLKGYHIPPGSRLD